MLFVSPFRRIPTGMLLTCYPKIKYKKLGKACRIHASGDHGAKYLYEEVYCDRGNAELFIKDHKNGLKSDRASCNKATANQFRLFLRSQP